MRRKAPLLPHTLLMALLSPKGGANLAGGGSYFIYSKYRIFLRCFTYIVHREESRYGQNADFGPAKPDRAKSDPAGGVFWSLIIHNL